MQRAQVRKTKTLQYGLVRECGLYERYIKRLLDISCSLAALIVFGWLYIIVAILVRVKLGSPVLFKQLRPGKIDPKTGKEKIFTIYKFRSMTCEKDKKGNLLPDEERLTRFGRILRSTSLDEIPELFNILKGDMSIVGPRPLVVSYLPYYTEEERHRHDVRPGLTGLAQVNGRNNLGWNEKFAYDIKYVSNLSFGLDVLILFKTVGEVLKKEGISQGGGKPTNLYDERQRKDLY